MPFCFSTPSILFPLTLQHDSNNSEPWCFCLIDGWHVFSISEMLEGNSSTPVRSSRIGFHQHFLHLHEWWCSGAQVQTRRWTLQRTFRFLNHGNGLSSISEAYEVLLVSCRLVLQNDLRRWSLSCHLSSSSSSSTLNEGQPNGEKL